MRGHAAQATTAAPARALHAAPAGAHSGSTAQAALQALWRTTFVLHAPTLQKTDFTSQRERSVISHGLKFLNVLNNLANPL